MTDDGFAQLRHLNQLRTLHIGQSLITDRGFEFLIDNCSQLVEFDCNDCRNVERNSRLRIGELQNLISLNLFNSPVDDEELKTISALLNLEFLDLGCCFRLTDTGIEQLANAKKLAQLSLFMCPQLSDRTLNFVATLESLVELDIRSCKFSSKALADLQTSRSDLTVYSDESGNVI